MNGPLIDVGVELELQDRYRTRKGMLSHNVIRIVDFDEMFTFVYTSWEDSAHDSRVLEDALNKAESNFSMPPEGSMKNIIFIGISKSKYYLCMRMYI